MEEWRDIPGFEGIYQASSFGRVKRLAHWKNQRTNRSNKRTNYRMLSEKIMSPSRRGRYLKIMLSKDRVAKTYLVHRLIANTFLPNPKGLLEVNHKDCNGFNNNVSNLEWCDRRYNINYADRTEKAAHACEKKVLCIETGKVFRSVTDASNKSKVHKSKISAVCNGKRKRAGGYHWVFYKNTAQQEGGIV